MGTWCETTDGPPDLIASQILQTVSDSVIVLDQNCRFTYANRAALQRAGVAREEVIGRTLWQIFPAWPAAFQRVLDAAAAGTTHCFEDHHEALGGWSEHAVYPSAAGVIIVSRDITDRKQTEQRLAYQAHVLEHVHDAIVATDDRLVVTLWNRAAESIYGWTAPEALGRDVREVVRSELDPKQRAELLREVQESGHGTVQTVHHRKDGTTIHIDGSVMALRDEAGRVTGYVAVHRDVSASTNTAEQLKKREAQLQEAQHLAHIGSWEWDIATDRVVWSDELYRIWGVEPGQFEGTYAAVRGLVHPDDRQQFDELIARASQTKAPYLFEHRIIRRDGTVRILQSRGSVMVDANGHPTAMLGTGQDITERKLAEADLQHAHDDLEQRVEERTRQLSIANADLRIQIAERNRADEALRESSRQIENILESITEAFVALDHEWRFTYINERALGRIRRAKSEELRLEDLVGKNFWEVFPEAVGTTVYQKYWEAMRERKAAQYETVLSADGSMARGTHLPLGRRIVRLLPGRHRA